MRRIGACALAFALAACSITGPEASKPVEYDLGPQPAYARAAAIPGAILIPAVSAPPWLADDGIVYRLLYQDASRPQTYAMSRWSAEPAALLTSRVRSRFAAVSGGVVEPGYGARSDYTLRVELEDFSQSFEQPGASRASLRARVTLVATADRRLIAQHVFDDTRPASPDAAGAVKALSEASDAFVEALVAWTVQNVKKTVTNNP